MNTNPMPRNIWTFALNGNIASMRQVQGLAEILATNLAAGATVRNFQPLAAYDRPQSGCDLSLVRYAGAAPDLSSSAKLNLSPSAELNLSPSAMPDLIIGCGPEIAGLTLAIQQAYAPNSKIIHIQNPDSAARRGGPSYAQLFDLILKQPHETLTGDNVLQTDLALHNINRHRLDRLLRHSRHAPTMQSPFTLVLLGGDDPHMTLSHDDFAQLGHDLGQYAAQQNRHLIVLSSRRTSPQQKAAFALAAQNYAQIDFDPQQANYLSLLARADDILVTADSLSMVSEALAAARPTSLLTLRGKLNAHPLFAHFSGLVAQNELGIFAERPLPAAAAHKAFTHSGLAQKIIARLQL